LSSAHGVVLSLKEVFQLPQFESTEQVSARQKLATWRRYWAKALDIALFVELVTLAKALLIRAEPPASPLPSTAWFYGSIAVFLVYEATALHRLG
jgi:hypothetical protein